MAEKPMSEQLLDAYQTYYQMSQHEDPTSEDVRVQVSLAARRIGSLLRIGFPATLEDYHEFKNKLLAYWRDCVGTLDTEDFEYFQTSGTSSGKPREYPFGPRSQEWITTLWNQMMYPFGWRPMVRVATGVPNVQGMQVQNAAEGLYQWRIHISTITDAEVSRLIQFATQQLDQFGHLTMAALPDVHLYLTRTPAFLDFVAKNNKRMNLMSWRWEPFFDHTAYQQRGIWCGNYMTDWPTGLNFHTCSAGHQHVLPIFMEASTGRLNALNLMGQDDWVNDSDTFDVTDVVRCACRLSRPVFTYRPRENNAITNAAGYTFFNPNLAMRLKSRFRSLQFVQYKDDTVTIHFDVDGVLQDKEILTDVIQQHGLKVAWNGRPHVGMGAKRIPFFRPTGTS